MIERIAAAPEIPVEPGINREIFAPNLVARR